MKTSLKILGISLLATIVFIVGSAILPFSDSFKELSSATSNSVDIIYLQIVNIWFTITVFYIGKNSDWSKKWLMYSLIFVYLAVYSFMTQIETLFFIDAFEILSKSDVGIIMLANSIPFAIIVPFTLKIANKNHHVTRPIIEIKLSTILWKVLLLAVVYVIIYFLFGYFVAWQFADLREFYSGTTEKQSFIEIMTTNFQSSNIISFQLLRGFLFSAFILPIVLMLKNKSQQLLLSLILVYLAIAIALILPNFLFPDTVRWAHFFEMTSSMLLFSVITWLIWRK